MISPGILPWITDAWQRYSKMNMCPVSKLLNVAISSLYLIIHSAEREKEAEKIETEGVTCDKSLMLDSKPGCYGNIEIALAN